LPSGEINADIITNNGEIGALDTILTLQDFYKSNKSNVEDMMASELDHIYPFFKLPGSYVKVAIE
jgi:hypothetical protein